MCVYVSPEQVMVQKPLIKQGYSLAEEIANSVSHGIGLVFGIVGLVLLLVQAVDLNASADRKSVGRERVC